MLPAPAPLHRQQDLRAWIRNGLISIFLPVGFPDSVTEDFAQLHPPKAVADENRFRILDMLQSIASQAALLLANRAVLQGVGVGDATSTATGAGLHPPKKLLTVVLLTVVQDSTGRIATILFAWLASSSLGTEPQKYRLLADLFNDLALLSDCTIPRILRALCGVMANGVGATMTAHFAKRGNLADVSAKSASLGTVAQLIGTVIGTLLLHRTSSVQSTWFTLLTLILLHLVLNYKAVKSVVLIDINRQRASLILSNLFDDNLDPRPLNNIPNPIEISKREHLFANNKILGNPSHTADIGVPSAAVFNLMRGPPSNRNALIYSIFSAENYILWLQRLDKHRVHILISVFSNSLQVHFKAWAHAYVLAKLVSGVPFPSGKTEAQILEKEAGEVSQALKIVQGTFDQGVGIERALLAKEWNLERSMMCAHMDGRSGEWRFNVDEKGEDIEKKE